MVNAADWEPITTGLSLTTLILYPVPDAVPAGIVILIVPLGAVPDKAKVPIDTGAVNDPISSDN